MRDSFEKFSGVTVSLHWIIAIGMIAMLAFGLVLEEMPRSPDKGELIGIHKSIGVLILFVAAIRVVWRYMNHFPQPLTPMTGWQHTLAKVAHWFLLLGTIFMPVSGIMMSVGAGYPVNIFGMPFIPGGEENKTLGQIGGVIHGLGGKLLILFVLLHVVGAVKHQFIDKDGTLSRMFGKRIDKKSA